MDLISRQDAIDAVHHSIFDFFDVVEDDEESPITEKDKRLLELNKAICNNIKALPSAQRKGKWILHQDSRTWECSECHKYQVVHSEYCMHCGADMRGEDNE